MANIELIRKVRELLVKELNSGKEGWLIESNLLADVYDEYEDVIRSSVFGQNLEERMGSKLSPSDKTFAVIGYCIQEVIFIGDKETLDILLSSNVGNELN